MCWRTAPVGAVRGTGDPPEAATRMTAPWFCPKMMTSSRLHDPPTMFSAVVQIVCTTPLDTSRRLSTVPVENATWRLSGDHQIRLAAKLEAPAAHDLLLTEIVATSRVAGGSTSTRTG